MLDMEKLADSVFDTLKAYLDREIAKRDASIAELRAQLGAIPAGKDGAPGRDGSNGIDGQPGEQGEAGWSPSSDDLELLTVRAVQKAVAATPLPRDGKDGKDGRDGASVPLEAVQALVRSEVSIAVAALPAPIAGKDGQPGKDGNDGEPGRVGKDGADAVIDVDQVVQALKDDPEAVAMLRGERGAPGDRGQAGADGKDGASGKDGAPVTSEHLREAIEARFAVWALDFERLATDRQRAAIDAIPLPRDGRDGKDGKPGAGLDDFEFEAELLNDRDLIVTLRAGGREVKRSLPLPMMVYRETWRANQRYERGDVVTFGGQLYFAGQTTQAKPGDSGDWRLCVRRGKDGKDAIE